MSCGTELPPNSKFCNECGAAVTRVSRPAEYKQVTVLFADVVHSMDIAAAVGPERLREIMADLVGRGATVVTRYGGTVDKFTGDGIMAVFGAPVALEDHAVRACLAALSVQDEATRLAADVRARDGVELQLRVGLNSGQVIAGEIGSGALGYTAMGEQVGMAQRMESVAPPGGVMLSASTVRLVDGAAVLGEPEMVRIKGANEPVAAYRLLAMGQQHHRVGRVESKLEGRRWEVSAVEGLLDRAIDGRGAVVSVVGPPGIGKSRLVREVGAMAAAHGVEVYVAFCESHTSQIPFHVVARLLRAALGVEGLDDQRARDRLRTQVPGADPEDLVLLDDLLGVGDADTPLPAIDADARRRRLTALLNGASLARKTPAVYVIEDVHWVDEVSESMIADFLAVVPQTPSLVLLTYRPEYEGPLARVHGAQTIALSPLSNQETVALVSRLLGADSLDRGVADAIADRAAGNPFFAEEIVRDLAERGVLMGQPGAYVSSADVADVTVPATLQATIAARIDRLNPNAKRTLGAAAVIGSRFDLDLLGELGVEPAITDLLAAQLVDQVSFTGHPQFVFHHPLIRAVAYEAQLKSERAQLHRRLATAIQERAPASVEENAALIAEHLHAASDLAEAFGWHMRAGTWLTHRDLTAARKMWQRARDVADRLPDDNRDRAAMRIAPRTMLCATAWLAGGSMADTGFAELRELTEITGDKTSLAIGMAGWVSALVVHARFVEASPLSSELIALLESIADPTLTLALLYAPLAARLQTGEFAEMLRLSQRMIDLADGDPAKGNLIIESPLAAAIMLRGCARFNLGDLRWRDDFRQSTTMVRALDATVRAMMLLFKYVATISGGLMTPEAADLQETAELLELAQRSGDDFTLACARFIRGLTLLASDDPQRNEGAALLAEARDAAVNERFTMPAAWLVDIRLAAEKAKTNDLDGAITLSRTVTEQIFASGSGAQGYLAGATAVLVEALLQRGTETDLHEAQTAIDRLAAVPTEPSYVIFNLWLLRSKALLAQARNDEADYQDYRNRYRALATSLCLEGHIAQANAMQ